MLDSKNTFTLVEINNPFDPNDRTIKTIDCDNGSKLDKYFDFTPKFDGTTFVASINGGIINDDEFPVVRPGNFVVVCPVLQSGGDSKDIFRIVAMIALVIVGNVYGAQLGGMLGFGEGLAGAVGSSLIMLGGSMLINAVLPPVMPDTPQIGRDSWNESPTYGWGSLRQSVGQGGPIPILFGTMRVAGTEITSFIDVISDKQYYNVMLGVCDGSDPVTLTDIRLNDKAASSYSGVTTHTREGSLNDTVIDGFDKIVSQKDVGSKLFYNTGVSTPTNGNAVEVVEIDLTAPYGMYYANDAGGLDSRSVDILVQYQLDGAGSWTTHNTTTISGKTTSAIRKTVSITLPAAGKYNVRCTRQTADTTSSREKTDVFFVNIREIVKQSLTYPGLAKYAVKALATDQLSGGVPAVTVEATRATVQVYKPGQGWLPKSATNPAWAYYALCNTYNGIPVERMLYDEIEAWADYCQPVGGPLRFAINIILDTQDGFWTQAQKICMIGRAQPVKRGSKYGVIADMPGTVSQMFTMGNITRGTFKLDYLPMIDRANAIEISFMDEDRDYTRQSVAVYSDIYNDATEPDKKASLRHFGCTNREQAIRHAAYQLNSNQFLVRSIEFTADVDAIATQVGDLFYFMHDAPNWGTSGRVVFATTDIVHLDQSMFMEEGKSYSVLIRLSDDTILDKSVVTKPTTTLLNGDFSTWTGTGWPGGHPTDWIAYEAYTALISNQGGAAGIYSDLDPRSYCYLQQSVFVENETYLITLDINYIQGELLVFALNDTLNGEIIMSFKPGDEGTRSFSYTASYNRTEFVIGVHANLYVDAIIDNVKVERLGGDVLEFTTPLDPADVPEKYDVYGFGEVATYKKIYRLTGMGRTKDLKKKLYGVEYNEAIYSDDGYVFTAPEWNVSTNTATKVYLHEYLSYSSDGGYLSNINVTWNPSKTVSGNTWDVWLEEIGSGVPAELITTVSKTTALIPSPYLKNGTTYKVLITLKDEGPRDDTDNTETIIIQGQAGEPADVTTITANWNSSTRNVDLTWTKVSDIDLSHYEIRWDTDTPNWDTATVAKTGLTELNTSVYISGVVQETRNYLIKAVDRTGNYSVGFASDPATIDTETSSITAPTGLGWTSESVIGSSGTEYLTITATWSVVADSTLDYYELSVTDTVAAKSTSYTTRDLSFTFQAKPSTGYSIKIRSIDKTGTPSVWSSPFVDNTVGDTTKPATVTWPASNFAISGFKLVGLNWNNNSENDIKDYNVQYSTSATFASDVNDVGYTFGNIAVVNGLDNGTTYYFRVKARDTSNNVSDSWSAIKSAVPGKVDTADIAADAVTANEIDAVNLSGIFADLGTVTAGKMQSTNFNDTTKVGMLIDLTNKLIKMYGDNQTGNRMQITSSYIKVYDDTDTLRVHLGDLSA